MTLRTDQISIPANIKAIMQDADYLGFDTLQQSLQAIVSDPYFTETFDFSYNTAAEVETLKSFRKSIIHQLNNI